ncbi:hypothetical protein BGZ60DRAFT_431327 [Tricladium varicosporioides]|nr:hypothetical protein BGZ60DRAFT_431327 [Hymenoscyphus varicosporioides]
MPASSAGDLADLVKIGALLFLAIFPEFGYWLLSTTTWVTCRIAVFLFALWHEYETKRIRARELDGDRLWRAKAQLSYGRLEIEPRTEEIGGGRARTPHGMEKAMADFELALDDAVRNSQPRRIHSNYSTVNVLMLSWEGEDADNLFIIYFAGHRFPENNNRWSVLPSSTEVLMRNVEKILAPQASDVLFLIGTPYKPYQGQLHENLARSESLLEVLTGLPHTSTSAFSFTKALIEALTPSEPPAGPICVQDLHLRVFQSLRDKGSPVLHSFSPISSQRSITLPVLGPKAPAMTSDKTPGSPSRQNSIGSVKDGDVLIHIRLSQDSDTSTSTQWIEWMKGIPASAKDVQIEASYRARSKSPEYVDTQIGDVDEHSDRSYSIDSTPSIEPNNG